MRVEGVDGPATDRDEFPIWTPAPRDESLSRAQSGDASI
jgi:hypothetical protein